MKNRYGLGKYILSICFLLVVVNVVLGAVLINESMRAMKDQVHGRMLDTCNTAAAMLDGDIMRDLQTEDVDTPEYQKELQILRRFEENIELSYIYCIREVGIKNFVFTIDPDPVSPGEFGSPVVYTEALFKASIGQPTVDEVPYEDEWGKFYSAYTPIYDSDHNIAGIVAVDFSADWYEKEMFRMVNISLIVILIGLAVSTVIVIAVTARYKKNLSQVFKEMNRLSEGIEALIREVSPGLVLEKEHIREKERKRGIMAEIDRLGDKARDLQTRLSKQIAIVQSRAYVDGLTGLGNRTAYEEQIGQMDVAVALGENQFSVLVFDINQLKTINDDFGHEEGDRIIIAVSKALKEVFDEDAIYRIGGDEFVIIAEHKEPEEGVAEFRKLVEQIAAEHPKLPVAISIGYAVYDRKTDKEYSAIFKRADDAMYADKRAYYQTHADRRKRG